MKTTTISEFLQIVKEAEKKYGKDSKLIQLNTYPYSFGKFKAGFHYFKVETKDGSVHLVTIPMKEEG